MDGIDGSAQRPPDATAASPPMSPDVTVNPGMPGTPGLGSGPGTEGVPGRLAARLRILAWATIAALVVQFLLGMADNLYLVVPTHHPWTDAHPIALLYAHVVVGIALLGNSFMVLSRSRDGASPAAVVAALAGLAGIAVALVFGVSFLSDGQTSSASMGMSAGFAVAVLAYTAVLWAVPSAGAPARFAPKSRSAGS